MVRAADAIVDILKTEGVRFVATLPGDDILPIFDALHQNGQMPLILTRHEQATVYIADGYARSTGDVGVAMVTKGPGRCNAFTAIVNAFTDCVPLLVIFGKLDRLIAERNTSPLVEGLKKILAANPANVAATKLLRHVYQQTGQQHDANDLGEQLARCALAVVKGDGDRMILSPQTAASRTLPQPIGPDPVWC